MQKNLKELCANFEGEIDTQNSKHVMIVFSDKYGNIDSLRAYILDRDLDVVCEQDWLEIVKPVMSFNSETVQSVEKEVVPTLKPKALERIREKKLVVLREQENLKEE